MIPMLDLFATDTPISNATNKIHPASDKHSFILILESTLCHHKILLASNPEMSTLVLGGPLLLLFFLGASSLACSFATSRRFFVALSYM